MASVPPSPSHGAAAAGTPSARPRPALLALPQVPRSVGGAPAAAPCDDGMSSEAVTPQAVTPPTVDVPPPPSTPPPIGALPAASSALLCGNGTPPEQRVQPIGGDEGAAGRAELDASPFLREPGGVYGAASPQRPAAAVDAHGRRAAHPSRVAANWACDDTVPVAAPFRSTVLGFLSDATDLASAAMISDAWYAAACDWRSWAPAFARTQAAAFAVPATDVASYSAAEEGDPSATVVFDDAEGSRDGADHPRSSNSLVRVVPATRLSVATARATHGEYRAFLRGDLGTPLRVESPIVAYATLHELKILFSAARVSGLTVLGLQWELAHLCQIARQPVRESPFGAAGCSLTLALLHFPPFVAAPPLPTPGFQAGYGEIKPHHAALLMATRVHEIAPSPSNVPWLLAIGRWAAEARDPCTGLPIAFHKAHIAPLLAVASSTASRLARVAYYWAVADCALAIARRYLEAAANALAARLELREAVLAFREAQLRNFTARNWAALRADERRYAFSPVVYDARRRLRRAGEAGDLSDTSSTSSSDREHPAAARDSDSDDPEAILTGKPLEPSEPASRPARGLRRHAWRTRRTAVEVLGDDDPRLVFSVLHHLRENYEKLREKLDEAVAREMGRYGTLELAAAGRRIALLQAAREVHEEEPVGPPVAHGRL